MNDKKKKGIKLRSGKTLFIYNDNYTIDGKHKPLLTDVSLPLRYQDDHFDDKPFLTEDEYEKELSSKSDETVTQSIEKKVSTEMEVPNGFGEVVGEYLEKINSYHQDRKIDNNQLYELVKGFSKYLSWFPDDVPQKKIKKLCREAYNHVIWKALADDVVSRRQFVDLI